MIPEELAGRRIAITGSTGFLGTALVERLLRCAPDCELVLILRPGRRGADRRVERDILRNDAFERLRADLGADQYVKMADRRITAVAGDVTIDGLGLDEEGQIALASCDLVIHSAAAVSFDSPLDQAVEVNLLGPVRIVQTLAELGVAPHLVAVSTCYVAGSRRGAAPAAAVDASPVFVEAQYRRYRQDATSVGSDWAAFFAGFELAGGSLPGRGANGAAPPADATAAEDRGGVPALALDVAPDTDDVTDHLPEAVAARAVHRPHRAGPGLGGDIVPWGNCLHCDSSSDELVEA